MPTGVASGPPAVVVSHGEAQPYGLRLGAGQRRAAESGWRPCGRGCRSRAWRAESRAGVIRSTGVVSPTTQPDENKEEVPEFQAA